MLRLLSRSSFWAIILFIWALALFILSSLSKTLPDGGPEIPHIDKFLHFAYFSIGGFALVKFLLTRNLLSSTLLLLIIPIVIFSILGALDEYHQTFTPGRSGNDPFDWLADLLGASAGIILANFLHVKTRQSIAPPAECR